VSATAPLSPAPEVSSDLEGARALVAWAANLPLRKVWSAPRVRADYCRRSPARLLDDGDLSFTAPCADLSGVCALALARAGLRPTLVLTGIQRPLQGVKFQSGLELELEGRTWVVGFAIATTYLYRGTFVETPRRPIVHRLRPEELDPERAFLDYFEPDGLDGLARRVPGYDLERDLRYHARKNNRLGFALSRRKASSPGRHTRRGRLPGAGGRWA
jgi:hypothetical protein